MANKRRSPQPIVEGGTNATTMTDTNGTTYYDGSKLATVSPGTASYIYKSQGAGSPPSFVTNSVFLTTISTQLFTTNDTYNVAANVKWVRFEAIGGGGGGGGVAAGTQAEHIAAAGGGGAGAYQSILLAASTLPASLTVTVGAGGAGGAAGNNPGTNGGVSHVHDGATEYVIANGGSGGSGSPVSLSVGIINGGGVGGAAGTIGDYDSAGSGGGAGFGCFVAATNRFALGGSGGNSFMGGGGDATIVGVSTAVTAGLNAGRYGSGGSGACLTGIQAAAAGGNGSVGAIIITEYIAKDTTL